jgi:hypothetical protein
MGILLAMDDFWMYPPIGGSNRFDSTSNMSPASPWTSTGSFGLKTSITLDFVSGFMWTYVDARDLPLIFMFISPEWIWMECDNYNE